MSSASDPAGDPGLSTLLREVVEGLGALLGGHIKLARVELEESARAYGRRVGTLALAVAFGLLGYLFACVAAALALARVVGLPVAFLLLGGGHLVGALLALVLLSRQLARPPLGETLSELDQTVSLLKPHDDAAPASEIGLRTLQRTVLHRRDERNGEHGVR